MPLNLSVPQWWRAVGGTSGHDIHACKLHGLFRFPEPPPSPCMVPSTSLDLPLLPEGLHPMACPYLLAQAQGHKAWAGDGCSMLTGLRYSYLRLLPSYFWPPLSGSDRQICDQPYFLPLLSHFRGASTGIAVMENACRMSCCASRWGA